MAKVGLVDPSADEIGVLSLQILSKLTSRASLIVVAHIEAIVTNFELLFNKHIKLVASKQEASLNIVRALLRVVYTLNCTAEIQEQPVPSFQDFLRAKVL